MNRRARAGSWPTVGAELEHLRLEHRARRLECVLRRLRHRAGAAAAGPRRRPGLDRAVADISGELERVRERLSQPVDEA